jgi:hypothetical protein
MVGQLELPALEPFRCADAMNGPSQAGGGAWSLRIGPIEAVDGTPVVDIKPVLADSADA